MQPQELTQLLVNWSEGDTGALDKLMPIVYGELRRIARHYIRQQGRDHTLETTGLIHEALLRLVAQEEKRWENRAHFLALRPRRCAKSLRIMRAPGKRKI
jgi:hypothetical protein